MAGQLDSGTLAAQFLGLDTAKAAVEIIAKSTSPAELSQVLEKRSYVMAGITPKEFCEQHATYEVDITDLQKSFGKICDEYAQPLEWDKHSRAVEFCSKVIFEVGPESRQIKKSDGDRVWKFKFLYKGANNVPIVKVAFISTFKAMQPVKQTTEADKIVLTIRQAGLLAMDTFVKLGKLILERQNIYLLTPLAGAIFSRHDIPEIALELKTDPIKILEIINSSCQSGGHMLPNSRTHCAVVAAMVATRNLKDDKLRKAIVSKVTRQYINSSKELNPKTYAVYARYAHGGLPKGMDFETLESDFEKAQAVKMSAKSLAKLKAGTTLTSTVLSTSKSPAGPSSP